MTGSFPYSLILHMKMKTLESFVNGYRKRLRKIKEKMLENYFAVDISITL